ncbi:MAG: hypothetical protein JW762_04825 [Dehalococcoidales bacterium]|nr:hypothetical protein [Dehalococcoidales bacterium]
MHTLYLDGEWSLQQDHPVTVEITPDEWITPIEVTRQLKVHSLVDTYSYPGISSPARH